MNKNKTVIKLIRFPFFAVLLLLPVFVLAQVPPGSLSISLVALVSNIVIIILNILWIVATAFTIIMFVLAGFKFITAQGEMEKVKEARNAVVWGVVGAAVIVLAWSIIEVVRVQIGV